MNKKILIYFFAILVISGCKNNNFQISGTLKNPVSGEYIFLDEMKANELKTIDSMKVPGDGTFSFKKEIKFPSFYLLKINNNNIYYNICRSVICLRLMNIIFMLVD